MNMLNKSISSFRKIEFGGSFAICLFLTSNAAAQSNLEPAGEDNTMFYGLLFVLALGLVGLVYWYLKSKKEQKAPEPKTKASQINNSHGNALDADKELEWLRKNQKLVGKKTVRVPSKKRQLPSINADQPLKAPTEVDTTPPELEKNSTLLPIFLINRLENARPFEELPISNDDDLMDAVEQGYDEFEEDEEVRELAVRVLAAFKKRNSVEVLSQIALYDLSSNLRSKAVSILSEFDHESVFETILLANADPTREVRAAAARSLTKLTFDRADAWTRITETGDEGRIVQAARAAIESGFVDMSFDRLISKDHKQAYEAFTLMALLIKARETKKIFEKLETHRDINVRRALLHVIKVTKDQEAFELLCQLFERNILPNELQEEANKTIEEIGLVAA